MKSGPFELGQQSLVLGTFTRLHGSGRSKIVVCTYGRKRYTSGRSRDSGLLPATLFRNIGTILLLMEVPSFAEDREVSFKLIASPC
jgi:hypothetical protein